LPEAATMVPAQQVASGPKWHVAWTRSNCEQLVCDQLSAKGLEAFLPKVGAWSRRAGRRHLTDVPLFPGYVFVHHAIDKASYIVIRKSIGLVSVLGDRWDELGVVPDLEIDAIKRMLGARVSVFPHPYLFEGQRVRINGGPLADIEGIFVRARPNKGLLVVSINMLHRSIAVEVDCTLVAAA
jgi:transcriptional antiterminator NusG